jgi:hypothetical protein
MDKPEETSDSTKGREGNNHSESSSGKMNPLSNRHDLVKVPAHGVHVVSSREPSDGNIKRSAERSSCKGGPSEEDSLLGNSNKASPVRNSSSVAALKRKGSSCYKGEVGIPLPKKVDKLKKDRSALRKGKWTVSQ